LEGTLYNLSFIIDEEDINEKIWNSTRG
jgi:hypothetical protein